MSEKSKVAPVPNELLKQIVQLKAGSGWTQYYRERPTGGEPAVLTRNYKGVNMARLLDILARRRCSYSEDQLEWFMPMLEDSLKSKMEPAWLQDSYGNVFVLINDGTRNSDVAFTSHLDTVAGRKAPEWHLQDIMLSPDGVLYLKHDTLAHCLGADDGAGVYIMLEMIKAGVPGRYCFFQDEEVGRVGSEFSAKDSTGFWTGVNCMISFDRRGDGVINSQLSGTCCSTAFAGALTERLGRPATAVQAGIYTDSASFMHLIPECTNIGVGYADEHTQDETLDLNILSALLAKAVLPETWRDLPIQREPVPAQDLWFSTASLGGRDWDAVADEQESWELNELFTELSQLSQVQLVQWVQENPKQAAAYIMVYSDFGFKEAILEIGNKVCTDWGGFNELVK